MPEQGAIRAKIPPQSPLSAPALSLPDDRKGPVQAGFSKGVSISPPFKKGRLGGI